MTGTFDDKIDESALATQVIVPGMLSVENLAVMRSLSLPHKISNTNLEREAGAVNDLLDSVGVCHCLPAEGSGLAALTQRTEVGCTSGCTLYQKFENS